MTASTLPELDDMAPLLEASVPVMREKLRRVEADQRARTIVYLRAEVSRRSEDFDEAVRTRGVGKPRESAVACLHHADLLLTAQALLIAALEREYSR